MTDMSAANDPQNVDDVLASIRKLVSDEAQIRSSEADRKEEQAAELADPLMLTTDQKVTSDEKVPPLLLEVPANEETKTPDEMSATDPADERGQQSEAQPSNDAELSAPFHDEIALRALISEIIREELQGEMGTRITRNVRKLIRREIEAVKNQDS